MNPLACSRCGFVFKSVAGVVKHQKLKPDCVTGTTKCTFCPRRFKTTLSPNALRLHERTCTKKPKNEDDVVITVTDDAFMVGEVCVRKTTDPLRVSVYDFIKAVSDEHPYRFFADIRTKNVGLNDRCTMFMFPKSMGTKPTPVVDLRGIKILSEFMDEKRAGRFLKFINGDEGSSGGDSEHGQDVLQYDNTNIIVLPEEFAESRLRMTPDKKWVSVFDVLKAVGYVNPQSEWSQISEKHVSEVVSPWYNLANVHEKHVSEVDQQLNNIKTFKFPGKGQRDTPCLNAVGVVKLITSWLPSSSITKKFRDKAAEIVVRYLGGDETLVEILHANDNNLENVENITEDDTEEHMKEDSSDISNETNIIVLPEEFAQFRLRMTPDKKWVSVFDVLKAIGYANTSERIEWGRISKMYFSEVVTLCHNFKFPGQGQRDTPCLNAVGVVKLITSWLPSSSITKKFRDKAAEIVVRYLGGDETLVEEVKSIRSSIEAGTAPAIAQFCAQSDIVADSDKSTKQILKIEGNDCIVLKSITNTKEYHKAQCYFRQVASRFTNVHPRGRPNLKIPDDEVRYHIFVKIGSQDDDTGRQNTHITAYNYSSMLVDSLLTKAMTHIERKCKMKWQDMGLLYEGSYEEKDVRDTELLVFKTQDDYEFLVKDAISMIENIGLHSDLEIEFVRENTKLQIAQLESDVRKAEIEASVRKTETEANVRKIEALEKTKRMKMRLDMKLN